MRNIFWNASFKIPKNYEKCSTTILTYAEKVVFIFIFGNQPCPPFITIVRELFRLISFCSWLVFALIKTLNYFSWFVYDLNSLSFQHFSYLLHFLSNFWCCVYSHDVYLDVTMCFHWSFSFSKILSCPVKFNQFSATHLMLSSMDFYFFFSVPFSLFKFAFMNIEH